MYTENTSDAWHIPRYPTRKHYITSIYLGKYQQSGLEKGFQVENKDHEGAENEETGKYQTLLKKVTTKATRL